MEIDEKLFLDVQVNTDDVNPCSPPMPNDFEWRGVIIRAPKRVVFKKGKRSRDGAFAVIPICGYCVVNITPSTSPIILFAIDKMNNKKYSGELIDLDSSHREQPPRQKPISPDEIEGLAVGSYFNPNLADFVKIPEKPAVYDVYVEYRGYRSNTVTIELVEEK